MTTWLEDLLDEYPTNRTDSAVARLVRVYAEESGDVMRTAVDNYMRQGKFFPKIADLRPFVDTAKEQERGDWDAVQAPITIYPDSVILDWEVARGSMRPLAEIEAEMEQARAELKAYQWPVFEPA